MLRICGAESERPAWSAMRCWCRGLFCGKGGFNETKIFRRQFHPTTIATSYEQFLDLIGQADLYDGDGRREWWIERLTARPDAPPRATRRTTQEVDA